MQRKIILAPTLEELPRIAARIMAEKTRQAIAERGRCTIALGGGSSVRKPYELFAASPDIDWTKVFFFWGDDRFVEPTNPYSNYTLGEESLLSRLPGLPAENIFGIPFKAATPAEGARQYSETIRSFFELKEGELPRFDLAQIGMGPDGHTASLFPHTAALNGTSQIAVMNHAGLSPWVDRITLTLPTINNARCALFLANGAAKAEVLRQVLEEKPDLQNLPASAVQPTEGELIWILDPDIASELRNTALEKCPA